MQLIRVTHRRCGDFDGNTFVLAPDDWSRKQTREAINKAQEAYLEGVRVALEGQPAPSEWRPFGRPDYAKYPDKTVAEIQAEWAALETDYRAWEAEQKKARGTFENSLKAQGLTLLWDDDAAHEFEVDWGHRHGWGLSYGEGKTDDLPIPAVAAGVEEDDDVW